jgi:NitT/TauT family transport system substrate-binding protein
VKKILSIVSLLFLVLSLAACGSSTASQGAGKNKLQEVRYAPLQGTNGLAVQYGIKKGFFKKAGLNIKLVQADDQMTILTSNEADIADAPTTSAIIAAGKGAPIKIVASLFRTKGPFYLIGDPKIKSVKELKGKKVGIGKAGTGLDLYTRKILKDNGVNLKEVTLVSAGSQQDAYSALINHKVDATIIHEPFVSLGEKTGKAKLLAKGWDYLPTFHTGVLSARQDFIKQKPELLRKFIRAYFESNRYAKSHLNEYLKYVQKRVKVDPEALKESYKRENVLWENNPKVNLTDLEDTQKIQKEFGFQDKLYDLKKIVDLKYIPKEDK